MMFNKETDDDDDDDDDTTSKYLMYNQKLTDSQMRVYHTRSLRLEFTNDDKIMMTKK